MTLQPTTSGHVYLFNGKRYPSVTTILDRTQTPEEKRKLRLWKKNFSLPGFKNATDYVEYTSTRGTFVHYNVLNSLHISTLDPTGLPPMSKWIGRAEAMIQEIETCRQQWEDLDLNLSPPYVIETPTYHPDLNYAGTPDITATLDGKRILFDLKTSNNPQDKHRIQMGGYAPMISRWGEEKIEEAMLVYLRPKKQKGLIVEISREELAIETMTFMEKLEDFWKIPGIRVEFDLV